MAQAATGDEKWVQGMKDAGCIVTREGRGEIARIEQILKLRIW